MDKKSILFKRTLVIGVIILFIGIGIHSSTRSTVEKTYSTKLGSCGYIQDNVIYWHIEPNTSFSNPTIHGYVAVIIEQPVPEAKWYKVERVNDSNGTSVIEDGYYPLWFDQLEFMVDIAPNKKGNYSADPEIDPTYLRVTGWSEKEKNNGSLVSNIPKPIAIHYDHRFENLDFTINASYTGVPGEVILRAIPDNLTLAQQIDNYLWSFYVFTGYDTTGKPIFGEDRRLNLSRTAKGEFKVSFSEPGIKYVRLYGAFNGLDCSKHIPFPKFGLKSNCVPNHKDKHPIALVVQPTPPAEQLSLPSNFNGPTYNLSSIEGDMRIPLIKNELSIFNGGSLFLPLGGSKPHFVEVDLPEGIQLMNYTRRRNNNSVYIVNDTTNETTPNGYCRYRLEKENITDDWSHNNRVLPLFFEFTKMDVIGNTYNMSIKAYKTAQEKNCSWQNITIHVEHISDVELPKRLRTGIIWAEPDFFMNSTTNPEISFLKTYKKLGFNMVPQVNTQNFDPTLKKHEEIYYFPDERHNDSANWSGMYYAPEHITFYKGFNHLNDSKFNNRPTFFNINPKNWNETKILKYFSELNLTPEKAEIEKQKWLNATNFTKETNIIDFAYDGIFLQQDIEDFCLILKEIEPDYMFIDSEGFPNYPDWMKYVNKSDNAEQRRIPGETDEDLAYRIGDEFCTAFFGYINETYPGTNISFYSTNPAFNYGFRSFPTWDLLEKHDVIPEPSMRYLAHSLAFTSEKLRLNRMALPSGYPMITEITTGLQGEYDAEKVFDVVAHTFLSGSTGFAVQSITYYDDGADFLRMAEAIGVISPYEDIVMDGEIAYENISNIENAVVSAMKLKNEYLIAVTPENTSLPVSFTVNVDSKTKSYKLYDIRHNIKYHYKKGNIVFSEILGEGTVFYLKIHTKLSTNLYTIRPLIQFLENHPLLYKMFQLLFRQLQV